MDEGEGPETLQAMVGHVGMGPGAREHLRRIVGTFPRVRFAAGYGSGVVPQAGDSTRPAQQPGLKAQNSCSLHSPPSITRLTWRMPSRVVHQLAQICGHWDG